MGRESGETIKSLHEQGKGRDGTNIRGETQSQQEVDFRMPGFLCIARSTPARLSLWFTSEVMAASLGPFHYSSGNNW